MESIFLKQRSAHGGINSKNDTMHFENFHWHDAIIKNITINRSKPGIKDEIGIEILWPENKGRVNLVFEEVYSAKMDLNFGIVADENIAQAFILPKSNEDLANFYSTWKGALDGINLNVYEILLNSTGGKIKIIAKRFRIDRL